ncbi:5-(carboxyamino)imidazole ribonucleotide synthase [Fodinicurvata sediminis]|uniref:5-(carboxyamino)imidazole ribonucleotide synthase n=1 Tax=Fodinicurvata sediminis TaxID=1121832 RepID=UPI0003B624D1|nr:5-(carboxyamino)imidazole ribonucleotide synthase [Fodinicurvata sediminis]
MTKPKHETLPPGSVIGILGGGQLGRMTALAAARLGYRSHIFCPGDDEPACQVTSLSTQAAYDDEQALAAFADAVDVVTFEFENVPSRTAEILAERVSVHPGPHILHICQNRLREKDFLASIQIPTTRYTEVAGPEAVQRALRDLGAPVILKSCDFGYDGKGQVLLRNEGEAAEAWEEMRRHAPQSNGVMEGFVDFTCEISVIAARGRDGTLTTYPAVENQHRERILDQTLVPARIPTDVADKAEVLARHIAEEMNLVGLIAVEMFVTQDNRVLVNEMAPRPHNSGHWSMDACYTPQFEQLVRAVTGLPLGSTERHSDAVMRNLIGAQSEDWYEILQDPTARLHLYGKAEARPGRKMGHVNKLIPRR